MTGWQQSYRETDSWVPDALLEILALFSQVRVSPAPHQILSLSQP